MLAETLNLQGVRKIYTISDTELDGDMVRKICLYYKRCGTEETLRYYRITERQLSKCLEGMRK